MSDDQEISAKSVFDAAIDLLDVKDATITRLREALEPFAKAADIKLCGDWKDEERFSQTDVGFHLNFGDLRRARAALEQDQ